MKILYIIRGLSGSGKTTLANQLSPVVYSADDWFTNEDGEYNFNPDELFNAHKHCQDNVRESMNADGKFGVQFPVIAVANTFSQGWEADPYFKLAEEFGYSPFVIECQNTFTNVHDVPQETIDAMRDRWESNLR